jgi:hypothetical protein
MRNLKIFAILTIMLIGAQITTAIQPVVINEPQLVNEDTVIQARKSNDNLNKFSSEKLDMLAKRYRNDLKECVPFHFNQYIDFFGLKIYFNIDINGWINNKCEYKISGQIKSIGKDIREVYEVKISDEQIAKFQPVVECHFDKSQLEVFVDGLFSKPGGEKSTISKMLESPEKKFNKNTTKLTPEEEKLAMMIMTENVCQVPNKEELMKQFEELAQPSTPQNL